MRPLAVAFAALVLAGCSFPRFSGEEEERTPPLRLCEPGLDRLPCRAGVEEGVAYPYEIYTHCGLDWSVYFDGRYWRVASGEQTGWNGNVARGTMTLEADGTALFRSDTGPEAHFGPAPERYRPPGCA